MRADYKITVGHWSFPSKSLKWSLKFGQVGTKVYGWPTKMVLLTDQRCDLILNSVCACHCPCVCVCLFADLPTWVHTSIARVYVRAHVCVYVHSHT